MFIGETERDRQRKRERERNIDARKVDWLTPIYSLTRDKTHNLGMCPYWNQTHNLLVYGTMLQPTEPPGQGYKVPFVVQDNIFTDPGD